MSTYSKGDAVSWNWGNGTGTGKVTKTFTSDVTRTIKGTDVNRKASKDDPAYLIEQEDGGKVLKSGSELKAASGRSSSGSSGDSLEDRTKDELYEKAKSKDIDGRSDMDKNELVKAIRKTS